MFPIKLLIGSFMRQRHRKVVAVLSVALGTAVALAMLAVGVDVGDKINRELKAFGANLVVTPKADSVPLRVAGSDLSDLSQGGSLDDRNLAALGKIFWRNNLLGYAPFLPVGASCKGGEITLVGGVFSRMSALNKSWSVQGAWPTDGDAQAAVVGVAAARRMSLRVGDVADLSVGESAARLKVVGVVQSGGPEDEQIFASLEEVQRLAGKPHQYKKLLVSALTTPESQIYERFHKDPRRMPAADFERWYCTPYASSIALQVQEALPGSTCAVVRQISSAEGTVLGKLRFLFQAVTVMALLAAVLAVTSTLSTTLLERSQEIGLMKALGCSSGGVAALFLAEAVLIGLGGGLCGVACGALLARLAGVLLFGSAPAFPPVLIPVGVLLATAIAVLGSLVQVRGIVRLHPAEVLHG